MSPTAIFPVDEVTPEGIWELMLVQVFRINAGVQIGETYMINHGEVNVEVRGEKEAVILGTLVLVNTQDKVQLQLELSDNLPAKIIGGVRYIN